MAVRRDGQSDLWEHVALFSGLGFVLFACIGGGTMLGWFIDKKLGSPPVATLIGSCFGLAVGLYELLRILKKDEERGNSKPPEN